MIVIFNMLLCYMLLKRIPNIDSVIKGAHSEFFRGRPSPLPPEYAPVFLLFAFVQKRVYLQAFFYSFYNSWIRLPIQI